MSDGESTTPAPRRRPSYGLPGPTSPAPDAAPTYGDSSYGDPSAAAPGSQPAPHPYGAPDGSGPALYGPQTGPLPAAGGPAPRRGAVAGCGR